LWAASFVLIHLALGLTNAIMLVAEATGISHTTIRRGVRELNAGEKPNQSRVRKPGGGRKRKTETVPEIKDKLEELVDPFTRGDPETPLKWVANQSVRRIANSLMVVGHNVSYTWVWLMLHVLGYSLQGNSKVLEGNNQPDRDAQFSFIARMIEIFKSNGDPVLSVDTKNKIKTGNFFNKGKLWLKNGNPIVVNDHDFSDKTTLKLVPYGIYDVFKNLGYVIIGVSADTAMFSVNCLLKWWKVFGSKMYSNSENILITCDSGGSNGYRLRLWKLMLQKLANITKKNITVCHYPPGISKWNKIEHCLFSYISLAWRGIPLFSIELVTKLIRSTTTVSGLKVFCSIDRKTYETGIKTSNEEMKTINIIHDEFHGEWNYTIKPQE
jgi:transposase